MKKIILITIILAGFSAKASLQDQESCNEKKCKQVSTCTDICKQVSTCTDIIGICEVSVFWKPEEPHSSYYKWELKTRVHHVYQCFGDTGDIGKPHLRGIYEDIELIRNNYWRSKNKALSDCIETIRSLNQANVCPEFLLKL